MKFRHIYTALAGLLVLAGCKGSEIDAVQDAAGFQITLTVNTCEPQLHVKSGVDGEDAYNENVMNTVHYFFFAKGSASAAVVKGSASGFAEKVSHTEKIPISARDLNGNLFDSDRKCDLFVIANAPASMSTLLAGNPTLAQLRAAAVVSNMNKVPQSNFVMVYDDEIHVDSRAEETAIDVEVDMKRLACKFTVKADVKRSLSTTDGSRTLTWSAATGSDALTVTFGNGINKTTPAGFNKELVEDTDYFEASPVELAHTGNTTVESTIYEQYAAVAPIYTYPMDWVFTDQFEPYLLFDMVWMYEEKVDDAVVAQYPEHRYYKMVLGQQSITENDWYVVTAKLSALGNMLPRDPLVLFNGLNYSVNNWNDAFVSETAPNTPATIKTTRFLMVSQTSWEVNNENECVIPISTSHPCEVVNVTVKKTEFHKSGYVDEFGNTRPNKPHDVTVVDWEHGIYDSSFLFTPNADWSELTFSHELNNELDENLDISPYWITLTVRHPDDHAFTQQIELVQYPAIWVESKLNSAGEDGRSPYKGFVYVNGGQASGSNWNLVGGTNRTPESDDSNSSRYMTLIHVSQFQPGAQFRYKDDTNGGVYAYAPYLVGDPRVTTPDNLDTNTSSDGVQWTVQNPVKADALFDNPLGGRQLTYYYPASRDFEHSQYVAPVLRVCSGQGRFGQNKEFQDVEQRCASYQEDGYPAGRWRLPTMAEASLIVFMSMNGFIPSIFTNTGDYAFANGDTKDIQWGYIPFVTANKGLNVRCVYDEWYWSKVDEDLGRKHGDELTVAERQTFVWGDVPRNYNE